ncbi:glycosyltransferase family 39 protein [Rhodocaloribacter litoris]|uniref:glycosyltransferase family 39 protein n=1 Tax=Rhodocaloribacter litoris TaxID=2558931 RepID=UPI001423D7EE|nr:glycosyltransferase family 39 protein [Rhodocaloribacter litoris]QXD16209.1 glycosyltransferase family 39 protein [Rhodocaloribacter litoris]
MGIATVRVDRLDDRYSRRELITLAGLTLLALITRGWGIWQGGIAGDEFYTVAYAAERARSLVQPAYYVLVVWSTALFGETAWAARLPAALLGAASVPVFYWACRRVLGRPTALIGGVLVLLSGWHLYHTQLARFYGGVFLFGVLSYFLYYRALREDRYGLLAAALLANVLGVLFHATAVLVPASCVVFSAWIWSRRDADARGYSRRIARMHVLITGLLGLVSLSLFVRVALSWGVKALTAESWAEPVQVMLQLVQHVEPVIGIAALFGLVHLFHRDLLQGTFFVTGIGIPVLGLLVMALILPPVRAKYIISTLPLFIALAAHLCAVVSATLARLNFGPVRHAVTGLVLVALLPGFISHYTGRASLDILDAIEAVEERYRPGDHVVVFSRSLGYHLEQQIPEGMLQVLGGKARWRTVLPPYTGGEQRVWVLVDTYRNQRYDDGLFAWLTEHAVLKWRKYEWRLDYQQMGFELYRVGR